MATVIPDKTMVRTLRLSFFFWMTAVMALFIFGGFGLTYWQPMATGTLQPFPPVVHLHGAFYTAWIVLLVTQAMLVNIRKVPVHRSLGAFGIAIATGVLITGMLLTLLFAEDDAGTTPFFYDLMWLSLTALVGFGLLFTLAIRQTRNPAIHRRLILFATIPLLPPGINRLYQIAFSLPDLPVVATYLTMDAIVAAMLIYDWRSLGRISGASIIGASIVLIPQLLHAPVSNSEAFAAFCQFLAELVYYR